MSNQKSYPNNPFAEIFKDIEYKEKTRQQQPEKTELEKLQDKLQETKDLFNQAEGNNKLHFLLKLGELEKKIREAKPQR